MGLSVLSFRPREEETKEQEEKEEEKETSSKHRAAIDHIQLREFPTCSVSSSCIAVRPHVRRLAKLEAAATEAFATCCHRIAVCPCNPCDGDAWPSVHNADAADAVLVVVNLRVQCTIK